MTSSTHSEFQFPLRTSDYLSVGVDLAERYSGLVALESDGTVSAEVAYDFGPRADQAARDKGIDELLRDLTGIVALRWPTSSYGILIEDLPPHGMVDPKTALRQQGYILRQLRKLGVQYELILPRQWQLPMGYSRKQWSTTKAWAKAQCEEFGFTSSFKGKNAVDTRDAYLIAQFGLRQRIAAEAAGS